MITSWHSYPKVWALGHANLKELLFDPVLVEEKIDGSQFSFGRFDGELRVRSQGKEMVVDAPEKMFQAAVDAVRGLDLVDGWTYRAEYLAKPKHNVLAYDRAPKSHLIIFDINDGHESYLDDEAKRAHVAELGLECVPVLYKGIVQSPETLKELLELESCLGGQKIEGFVIKNYARFGADKKALMGKYVSEAFKEAHKKDWRGSNPTSKDVVSELCNQYKNTVRWDKAIMRLKESGELEFSPKDIGKLMKEVPRDVKVECEAEIKEALFKWAWPKIQRSCVQGLPEFYKKRLMEEQFK